MSNDFQWSEPSKHEFRRAKAFLMGIFIWTTDKHFTELHPEEHGDQTEATLLHH